MKPIGPIVRLQIQPESIKVRPSTTGPDDARAPEVYDPTRLVSVSELHLTRSGATATVDGREVIDVHHAHHPRTKSRGENPLSVGFTSHYDALRERFGPNVETASAGESIIVETNQRFTADDLARGLAVERADGTLVKLAAVIAAAPCRPFSEFLLQTGGHAWDEPAAPLLRETLRFLSGGTRGVYCQLDGEPAAIALGDLLFAL